MPGKQYVVLRDFSRIDPQTGDHVPYKQGGVYSGEVEDVYFDAEGPDNQGPLLADKSSDEGKAAKEAASDNGKSADSAKAPDSGKAAEKPSTDSSSKEKN